MFASLDLDEIIFVCLRLLLAFALALPIAWDREREARSLGLRTFPLVAIASAAYALLARTLFGGDPSEESRVLQGLITGIGFLGGGAILKRGATVSGTATAASLWATAAVGAAVAYDRYEIALVLAAATFATLRWMTPLKGMVNDNGVETAKPPSTPRSLR